MIAPQHGLGGSVGPALSPAALVTGLVLVIATTLVLLRRAPAAGSPRPVPAWLSALADAPATRLLLRGLGLVAALWVFVALVAGPDQIGNPALGTFYVLVWVGLVPLSLLFGRVVRAVSPVRTLDHLLSRVGGSDPATGIRPYPPAWGVWPAALGLVALSWQQLADPDGAYLDDVQLWLTGYLAAMLVGAAVFGEGWIGRADPFEVWSDLVARLSPWRRDPDGRLLRHAPPHGLDDVPREPGTVAVVVVVLGATLFDAVTGTRLWDEYDAAVGSPLLPGLLGLLGAWLVAGLGWRLAAGPLAARLAPGLVPLAVGLLLAHYAPYAVEQGQTTLLQLGDPLVRGQDLLGLGGLSTSYVLSFHPHVLEGVKVVLVLLGHALATTWWARQPADGRGRLRAVSVFSVAWTTVALVLLSLV